MLKVHPRILCQTTTGPAPNIFELNADFTKTSLPTAPGLGCRARQMKNIQTTRRPPKTCLSQGYRQYPKDKTYKSTWFHASLAISGTSGSGLSVPQRQTQPPGSKKAQKNVVSPWIHIRKAKKRLLSKLRRRGPDLGLKCNTTRSKAGWVSSRQCVRSKCKCTARCRTTNGWMMDNMTKRPTHNQHLPARILRPTTAVQ